MVKITVDWFLCGPEGAASVGWGCVVGVSVQGEFGAEVNKAEESLWEEQWLGCAQRLCQWDVLAEFGAEVENYDVLLDSCWRLGNWSMVRERVLPRAQVGAHESTKLAIVRAYSRLEEGSVESIQEADNSIAQVSAPPSHPGLSMQGSRNLLKAPADGSS